MKFYIPLFIMLFVLGSLWFVLSKNEAPSFYEGKIKWIEQFQQGLDKAKVSQKPILVFFNATWCYWCRKLNQDVFMKDEIEDISKQFINVLIDVEKDPKLARKFGVRGVPDVYFLDQNGKKIIQYTGNRTSKDMITQMQAALEIFEE
ncbi:membrane or secreted protein containing Thioredoxin domain protein [Candidatus Magnetomorum sp. HK-1]|nr:membrane or secreted protein containing Thioredoxin domain protein [Candidatus Magnetomorum sp. HK-1]